MFPYHLILMMTTTKFKGLEKRRSFQDLGIEILIRIVIVSLRVQKNRMIGGSNPANQDHDPVQETMVKVDDIMHLLKKDKKKRMLRDLLGKRESTLMTPIKGIRGQLKEEDLRMPMMEMDTMIEMIDSIKETGIRGGTDMTRVEGDLVPLLTSLHSPSISLRRKSLRAIRTRISDKTDRRLLKPMMRMFKCIKKNKRLNSIESINKIHGFKKDMIQVKFLNGSNLREH